MFWIFLLIATLAVLLIKLGAATVMVSVLSTVLQVAVFVIAVLAVLLIWKKLSRPSS